MKLASYMPALGEPRIGCLVNAEGAEYLLDLAAAYAQALKGREPFYQELARVRIPSDMRLFLEGGPASMDAAQQALDYAATQGPDTGLFHGLGSVRWLPPVPRPGKVISVGLNYPAHLSEADSAGKGGRPAAQPAFGKFPSVLIGHEEPIVYPRRSAQLDYELELCLVIGTRCKEVAASDWLDAIAGYTIVNDVSMRDIQFAEMKAGLLCMGKNLDCAGPLGPFLVTKDEITNPQDLHMQLRVNGEVRQDETTANMIFKLDEIVEYWSAMTLEPGDVITTGSPAGVAIFRDQPERYLLKPGDVIEGEIEGLGVLRNRVVAPE